jgi:predicted amidophosphoribosyltransferase
MLNKYCGGGILMSEKKCPLCGGSVDVDAKECGYCGASLVTEESKQENAKEQEPNPNPKSLFLIFLYTTRKSLQQSKRAMTHTRGNGTGQHFSFHGYGDLQKVFGHCH